MGLGSSELIVILIIVLVLFGGSRLPSLMEGMGKGLRSFKKAVQEDDEDPKKLETQAKSEPTR